jgi:hypothetical protein
LPSIASRGCSSHRKRAYSYFLFGAGFFAYFSRLFLKRLFALAFAVFEFPMSRVGIRQRQTS